jgi:hypothetical protein
MRLKTARQEARPEGNELDKHPKAHGNAMGLTGFMGAPRARQGQAGVWPKVGESSSNKLVEASEGTRQN